MNFRHVELGCLGLVLLLSAIVLVQYGALQGELRQVPVGDFTPSLLVGALLMTFNLLIMAQLLQRLFLGGKAGGFGRAVVLLLPLKTLFLGLAVFILFHYLALQPLGFMCGMVLTLLVPLYFTLAGMLARAIKRQRR